MRWIVLWLFFHSVFAVRKYVIDRQSCGEPTNGEGNHATILTAIETAISWAEKASTELSKPEGERTKGVTEKAQWIFGTEQAIQTAAGNLKNISLMKYEDKDPRKDDSTWVRDYLDVEVYCDGSFYEDNLDNDGNVDKVKPIFNPRRGTSDEANDMVADVKAGKGDHGLLAYTEAWTEWVLGIIQTGGAPRHAKKPSLIVINPWYLEGQRKEGWPKLDKDRIEKAKNPGLLKSIGTTIDNFAQSSWKNLFGGSSTLYSNVDILNTLTTTMLHELAHTNAGGTHHDVPDGESYGWANIVKAKNPQNADGMAYMGMLTTLIKDFKYDVSLDGKVSEQK